MKSLILLGFLILFTTSTAYSAQIEPLERAPSSQTYIQSPFGEELSYVLVDQQVLIVADVTNGLAREQPFAYIVQIQDDTGAVVSLGWLAGVLAPNQMLSPALSWTPQYPGTYHSTIFVWSGINNPDALSVPLELDIDVRILEA